MKGERFFYTAMLSEMLHVEQNWQEMRQRSKPNWVSFCKFIKEVYREMQADCQTESLVPDQLVDLFYSVLTHLAKHPCVNHLEEVSIIYLQHAIKLNCK